MNRKLALAATFLSLSLLPLSPPSARAQDESVKPGINDPFRDAQLQVDAFVKRFETESREIYRFREAIVAALGIEEGEEVADVGAGTGLFTRLIAPHAGPEGKVFAIDIAEKFVEHSVRTAKENGFENVEGVVCTDKSIELPEDSIDLAFVCDTYHHFEFPQDTLASIRKALRPGGRLVVVDFERIVGVSEDWVLGHVRCGKGTVTDELRDAGFELEAEIPLMDTQYFLRFRERAE